MIDNRCAFNEQRNIHVENDLKNLSNQDLIERFFQFIITDQFKNCISRNVYTRYNMTITINFQFFQQIIIASRDKLL